MKNVIKQAGLKSVGKVFTPSSTRELQVDGGKLWIVEELTPSIAQGMLANQHPGQRALRQRHALSIARAMESGQYKWTADPIKLDRQGRLIDGQHRLAAVVMSKCTILNAVVAQIDDDDVYQYLDTVSRPRNLRDVRGFLGQRKVDGGVAAAIALEFADFNISDRQQLTVPEVNHLVESFPFIDEAIELYRIGRLKVHLTAGPLAGALRCLRANQEMAHTFFMAAFSNTQVVDGKEQPVVRLLSEFLIRSHAQRAGKQAHGSETTIIGAEKAVRAYNAWRLGENLSKLQQNRTGEVPNPVG